MCNCKKCNYVINVRHDNKCFYYAKKTFMDEQHTKLCSNRLTFSKVREQKGKHTDRQFFHNTISKFLTIGLSSARAISNKKYFSKSEKKKKSF